MAVQTTGDGNKLNGGNPPCEDFLSRQIVISDVWDREHSVELLLTIGTLRYFDSVIWFAFRQVGVLFCLYGYDRAASSPGLNVVIIEIRGKWEQKAKTWCYNLAVLGLQA